MHQRRDELKKGEGGYDFLSSQCNQLSTNQPVSSLDLELFMCRPPTRGGDFERERLLSLRRVPNLLRLRFTDRATDDINGLAFASSRAFPFSSPPTVAESTTVDSGRDCILTVPALAVLIRVQPSRLLSVWAIRFSITRDLSALHSLLLGSAVTPDCGG